MNENFNIQRFWQYFSFDFRRIFREHGLTLLLFSLAPLYLFILYSVTKQAFGIDGWRIHNDIEGESLMFFTSLAIMLVFPILCYGTITDRKKGAQYLLTPASSTEKYLSMLIMTLVIAPAVFYTIYLASDLLLTAVFPEHYACNDNPSVSSLAEKIFTDRSTAFMYCPEADVINLQVMTRTFFPFAISAAGLAGGVFFKKSKTAKTVLFCLLLSALLVALVIAILDVLEITRPEMARIANTIWYVTETAAALGFLAFAYFRTKKIEL